MVTPEQLEAAWVALGQRCAATPVGSPDFQKVTRLIQVSKDDLRAALEAAEKAREAPHELIMKVQSDPRVSQSASFHSPAPYVPQEPVTITRIVVGFPTPRSKGEE